MNPIDVVLSIIPRLTDKERAQVLEILKPSLVCDKTGHKFKVVGEVIESWYKPKKTKLVCTACGKEIIT